MIDTLGIVASGATVVSVAGIAAVYRAVKTAAAGNCTVTFTVLSVKWAPPSAQQRAAAAAEQPALTGVPDRGAA